MDEAQLTRKNDLEKALGDRGLTLRKDSKLCYCYVNGQVGPEWDLNRVVHECSVMHWLYNFTNYQKMCDQAARIESHRNYFHTQRDLMSYMRRYIHPLIKEQIITHNGGIPTVWPWIKDGDITTPGDTTSEENNIH